MSTNEGGIWIEVALESSGSIDNPAELGSSCILRANLGQYINNNLNHTHGLKKGGECSEPTNII